MEGRRFGDYLIEARLAAGGMGEVFRARDEKLGRPVALKLLNESLSRDGEYARRFEREARHAAGLNHPAIATIYATGESEGRRWLAMEFLEGETLADRMVREKVPPARALEWIAQLADGLAAAHAKGLVHRDIKPANLMILPDGRLKILDFGLAKPEGGAVEHAHGAPDDPQGATRDLLTAAGTIVGTVAYMSPEQARGEPLDRRSDIFSAGTVLYELLTGKHPFRGKSTAETLGNLLYHHPEAPRLDTQTTDPGEVARILRKALAKERDARYQHADELAVDLRGARRLLGESGPSRIRTQPVTVRIPAWPRWKGPLAKAGLLAAGALLGYAATILYFSRARHGRSFTVQEKPDVTLLTREASIQEAGVISPDGKTIAFQSDRTGPMKIFVRAIGSTQTLQVTSGEETDTKPLFSPDGATLAYQSERRLDRAREIRLVPALGGNSRKLLEGGTALAFYPDGAALLVKFCAGEKCGLYRLPVEGGAPEPVLLLTRGLHEMLRAAAVTPDGKKVHYFLNDFAEKNGGLYELPLMPAGKPRRLVAIRNDFGTALGYGRGARRIYFSACNQQSNFANVYAFDTQLGSLRAVTGGANINLSPSLSRDGRRLVYTNWNESDLIGLLPLSGAAPQGNSALRLVTRGREDDEQPAFSPDGRRLAFVSDADGDYNLWLHEIASGEKRQITFGSDGNFSPVFSADGREIFFYSNRGGKTALYAVPAEGGQSRLVTDKARLPLYISYAAAPGVSPDGRHLTLGSPGEGGEPRLQLVDLPGGGIRPLGEAAGFASAWSPDGKFVYAISRAGDAPHAIWRYDLSGRGEKLAEINAPLINNYLSLTADGRTLFFLVEAHPESHVREVWRYDLATKRAAPVTAFADDHPRFGAAISPDGTKLALSLNRVDSNIVLLDGLAE